MFSLKRLKFLAVAASLTACQPLLPQAEYTEPKNIFHLPGATPKNNRQDSSRIIDSWAKLKKTLKHSGTYILLAEIHSDLTSKFAIANMMAEFKANNVTVIGLEFPTFLQPLINESQEKARKENLGMDDISNRILEEFKRQGIHPSFGAEVSHPGLGAIIRSAALEHIRVEAIDVRFTDSDYVKNSDAVEDNAISTGDYDTFYKYLLYLDTKTSQLAVDALKKDPPGSHMIILFGAHHSLTACSIRRVVYPQACIRNIGEVLQEKHEVTRIKMLSDRVAEYMDSIMADQIELMPSRTLIPPDAIIRSDAFTK